MVHKRQSNAIATACLFVLTSAIGFGSEAYGGIDPDEVLVVYNSQNADSLAVWNHYQSARPGVLGFDLNDASVGPGDITYTDFESQIRDPLRSHLGSVDPTNQVISIVLTKGLPHRISDTDNASVGDAPGSALTEFNNGDATYASVDSELTLLWQDLRTRPGSGEAGGSFDSFADNFVANPYFNQTAAVDSFSRSNIDEAKSFIPIPSSGDQEGWAIAEPSPNPTSLSDPGDIYLVTRLDGDTAAQVNAAVTRGLNPVYNLATDRIILDENAAPDSSDLDGDDYQNAADLLTTNGYQALTHDTTDTFVIGATGSVSDGNVTRETGDVAFLGTYGGNHSDASQDEYLATFDGQLVEGAIFNSIESYNGRPLGGLSEFADQASLAEWIAAGGSFGIGNVAEPFAGTVADNDILLENFLYNGLTWAEAAYAALPFLSWQQIVIGDPLSTATVIVPEPSAGFLVAGMGSLLIARRRTRGSGSAQA